MHQAWTNNEQHVDPHWAKHRPKRTTIDHQWTQKKGAQEDDHERKKKQKQILAKRWVKFERKRVELLPEHQKAHPLIQKLQILAEKNARSEIMFIGSRREMCRSENALRNHNWKIGINEIKIQEEVHNQQKNVEELSKVTRQGTLENSTNKKARAEEAATRRKQQAKEPRERR